jgi:transposase InsO family protein
MAKKTYKPEEIVAKLRQVDVLHSQGMSMADAIRQISVSEVTFYRWRKEYGGLKADQLKRLKELEKENARLRRAVSDLTLDKMILSEADRTHDGRVFRTLNLIDEYTKECLMIRVKRKLNSIDVIDVLTDLFILRGPPAFIRSDNGPEFVAEAVRDWIAAVGSQTAYIVPGSPWENGYCESFNARFRDELLNGEIFYTLKEAQIVFEEWRKHYNTVRPHSALGYRPPAPETVIPLRQRP